MKKLFAFSAMCATLVAASSCGGSEKVENPAPAEEATAWSSEFTFDTNGDATGKEVTNYGQNGQIVSVDKYSVDKESKQMVLTDHVIYQNGKPSYSNVLKADGSVEGHEVYTYNEQGNLTEMVIESYSEGLKRIAPSSRYVYSYDTNGDVVLVSEQKKTPKDWSVDYEWKFNYDAQGRVISRDDYTGGGKDQKHSCQYRWTYNDNNTVQQLDYLPYDLKTSRLKHDSKTQYKYNAAGQVVEALVIRHKADKKRSDINSRKTTYEYNAAGQLSSYLEQKWNNGTTSWYEVSSGSREYDAAGQVVKITNVKNTNKGTKFYNEVQTVCPPSDKVKAAPAAPAFSVKPEIDLNDKHMTSKETEE